MKFYQPSVSFASGELTPVLAARVDLAAYAIGAKEITNMIVLPQGGLINRPGTKHLSSGSALYGARLIPFIFNADTAYCLVYKEEARISVYDRTGAYVEEIDKADDIPIVHYYPRADLAEIRWLQSADIIYIFHPNHPVQRIERRGTGWSMKEVEFKNGPYQDMNTDPTLDPDSDLDLSEIEMSIESRTVEGEATLRSNVPYFTQAHVGLLLKLEFTIEATGGDFELEYAHDETAPPAPAESEAFEMFGPSTIKSGGKWTGLVEIYRKRPEDSDYIKVKEYRSDDDYNFGYQEDVQIYGTLYKLAYSRSAGRGRVNLEWSSGGGLIARQVRTHHLVNSRTMWTYTLDDVTNDAGPSKDWAWGAFGPSLGYPALGIFHQERLILANSPCYRQTLWMSQSASWEDFGTSIPLEDTDAITMTLAAKRVDEITGLASRSDLLIFTVGGEWVAKSGRQSDVFTPTSVVVTPSGYHGSHNMEPLDVGSFTLFVQRHGKVVRGMGYKLDIDGYSSNELSILSSHLFEGARAERWTYQQEPWSAVWIVLDSGDVLALTLQQEHQVTAWTRNRFHTPVQDVCCIPGAEQDEVFYLCATDGQPASSNLVMLRHRRDATGEFDANTYKDESRYGYVSAFESMELEQNANGSLQGRHKQVPQVTMRVFRSGGFHAGIMTENSGELDQIAFPGELSPKYRDKPYTGDVHLAIPGGVGREARLRVENRSPRPLTLLGYYQTVEVGEG